jgi:hypothetical protein
MREGVRVNRIGVGMSNRQLFSIGLVLVAYATATIVSAAEQKKQSEAVEIPLNTVWAYNMPGTRDVRALELESDPANRKATPLTSGVLQSLINSKRGQEAKPGFAVAGMGVDALREAHSVLADNGKPQTSFTTNDNVSVVFFSHPFNYYVHLSKVEQKPDKVVITYSFVPHRTKEMTRHFALIPLGKLSPGKVKVEIVRAPMQPQKITGFKPPSAETDARIVARPFQFEVVKREK